MEMDTLRTFVEVMRRGSFAAVARSQGVAPSSISRAIASLEDELGLRLFQRTTRRLAPTEAGELYFKNVEPLVAELDQAELEAADVHHEPRGALRITAPVTFAQRNLVPLVPELLELYPQLSIDIRLTDTTLDMVAEQIDVAVRLGHLRDSTLVAKRLSAMTTVVCASPKYLERHGRPREPADLESHDCLVYSSNWRFRDAKGNLSEPQLQRRCVISNILALQQCAIAGAGVAMLPSWAVGPELEQGLLEALLPGYDATATLFDLAIWLVYPTRSYVPLKVRAFVNFLEERFADGLPGEGTRGPNRR